MTHTGKKMVGPQQLGRVMLSREEARRLDQFVIRIGRREAASRLGVGESTVVAGVELGTMLAITKARLLEALGREERRP